MGPIPNGRRLTIVMADGLPRESVLPNRELEDGYRNGKGKMVTTTTVSLATYYY